MMIQLIRRWCRLLVFRRERQIEICAWHGQWGYLKNASLVILWQINIRQFTFWRACSLVSAWLLALKCVCNCCRKACVEGFLTSEFNFNHSNKSSPTSGKLSERREQISNRLLVNFACWCLNGTEGWRSCSSVSSPSGRVSNDEESLLFSSDNSLCIARRIVSSS